MKYKNRVLELHRNGEDSATAIAKIIVKEGLTDTTMRSVRSNVRNWISGLTPQSKSEEKVADRPFVLSAWNDSGYMMDIDEYCEHYALPRKDIKSYKLVSHTGTPFYNVLFKETILIEEADYIGTIKKLLQEIPRIKLIKQPKTDVTDRLIYTDVHCGMDASRKGLAQYAEEWNGEELLRRVRVMISRVIEVKTSNTLIIDELGDYMDGANAQTTRGGHYLPQNMTNEESFDTGLAAKMMLAKEASKHWDYVIFNNICEDNHAGWFGYVVNSAFKSLCEVTFNNVEVVNHQKFINHYFIGKHCHVITHGKDSRNLKFGFKPMIDSKQIEKIDQYLKHEGIYERAEFIEFTKGDSHQYLMDCCSSDDFDYFNVMAFSPSSEWVQTNFKKGRSGFVIQSISNNTKDKVTYPVWF